MAQAPLSAEGVVGSAEAGDFFCKETMRAGSGPLTTKTLPDCLLLNFFRCVVVRGLGDVCR